MVVRRQDSPEMKILMEMLKDGQSLDYLKVSASLGVCTRNARRYLKVLRDNGCVYVAEWKTSGRGPYYPLIRLGNLPDAVVPGKKESAERKRKYKLARTNKYKLFLGL